MLNENTIWQTDFVTFSLVAATFIGAPYLLLSRGHVNVDVLPLYLGPKGRYLARARRGADVVCVLRRHGGADLQFLARGVGEQLALGIDVAGAAVDSLLVACRSGLGIISLQYVAEIIKLVTGREPPFGLPPKATAEEIARAQAKEAVGGML